MVRTCAGKETTAAIALLALFFVRAFFTETKGRSLEEIEADLRDRTVSA